MSNGSKIVEISSQNVVLQFHKHRFLFKIFYKIKMTNFLVNNKMLYT